MISLLCSQQLHTYNIAMNVTNVFCRQLMVMDETYVMNQCKEDVCYVSTQFNKDMKLSRQLQAASAHSCHIYQSLSRRSTIIWYHLEYRNILLSLYLFWGGCRTQGRGKRWMPKLIFFEKTFLFVIEEESLNLLLGVTLYQLI